jgi:hypothetical protein
MGHAMKEAIFHVRLFISYISILFFVSLGEKGACSPPSSGVLMITRKAGLLSSSFVKVTKTK